MTKLQKAIEIIEENYKYAELGIFNNRNILGDPMTTIYNEDGLCIDICYYYEYFEVFGLSDEDFSELKNFYISLG